MQLLTAKTCYPTLGVVASVTALPRWRHTSDTTAGAAWAASNGAGAASSGSEEVLKRGQILAETGQNSLINSHFIHHITS